MPYYVDCDPDVLGNIRQPLRLIFEEVAAAVEMPKNLRADDGLSL